MVGQFIVEFFVVVVVVVVVIVVGLLVSVFVRWFNYMLVYLPVGWFYFLIFAFLGQDCLA